MTDLRRRRSTAPPPRRNPAVWIVPALALVGLGAGGYFAMRPRPEPAVEAPPPPPRLLSPAEILIEECDQLIRAGKFKEALEKIDWYPTRDLGPTDAGRVATARTGIQKKAAELVESRAKEAEELARKGKLQEGADRLQDLVDLAIPAVVGDAYQRLRNAANDGLAALRKESHERTLRELAGFAARDAAAKPPADPDAAWKRAEALLKEEKWAEAIEAFTALAADKKWRTKALVARAQAHHGAQQPVGVLHAASLLLEAGEGVAEIEPWLERALTRGPIDETLLQLYQRLLEKNVNQPRLWRGICRIHTWRHDVERASAAYRTAVQKGVQFDGPTSNQMIQYAQLKTRGFPPGKPVVVDYAGPYEILTDATPKRARELARQLESIAKEYSAGFKHAVNPDFRFRVMFFSQDAEFQLYHRAASGRTAEERGVIAYYSSGIKQLVVVDSPREFLQTVRHEAYHQFLDYFVDEAPRWFNEGTAAYFEQSTFGKPGFDKKYHGGARYALAMNSLPPLAELVSMPVERWVTDPREFFFYCQAWSFIYWLRTQGRGELLDEYFRLLMLGHPMKTVNERVFGSRITAFEPSWREAVKSGRYEK